MLYLLFFDPWDRKVLDSKCDLQAHSSLNVIFIGAVPYETYDFLVVFCRNYVSVLHLFHRE